MVTNTDAPFGSEPYTPHNVFDRITRADTLELHYRQLERREREILRRRFPIERGEVLSIGCGWHPGRHLFPAPAFRMTGVDIDPVKVQAVLLEGIVDAAFVNVAGAMHDLGENITDVVLYRLVLHHVAFHQPLAPCFTEAARILRPGGAMIAIEPGLWHPVGAALALANRTGTATALHGTPDDVPLSPRKLLQEARQAGLDAELHAVTYTWRRLPAILQRAIQQIDGLGSRPRAAMLGHTLMLIARKPVR
jgi:SAM-dependent methyltransferase